MFVFEINGEQNEGTWLGDGSKICTKIFIHNKILVTGFGKLLCDFTPKKKIGDVADFKHPLLITLKVQLHLRTHRIPVLFYPLKMAKVVCSKDCADAVAFTLWRAGHKVAMKVSLQSTVIILLCTQSTHLDS